MRNQIKTWYSPTFTIARIVTYIMLFLYGIYIVFFDQTYYACNLEGQSCPFCGMKTAVHCVLQFRFTQANELNPRIWLLCGAVIFMVLDTAIAVYIYGKRFYKEKFCTSISPTD